MKLLALSFTLLAIFGLTGCTSQTPPPPPPTATTVSLLTQPTPANPAIIAQSPSPTLLPSPPALPTLVPSPPSSPTAVPSLSPTPLPQPTATNTLVPTPTPIPSPTAVPAPVVQVPLTSTNAINVRSGPGTDYPVLGQFEPGQTAPVLGRNNDTSWWEVSLTDNSLGWVFGELVTLSGSPQAIPVAEAPPPPPTATPAPAPAGQTEPASSPENNNQSNQDQPPTTSGLRQQLNCTQDFCVTYQAMVPIWENGGCIGNHSIYVTVLEGPPPGRPMDGLVIGDTFNNVEVASGDKGPGSAEITLWMNSMSVKIKRHINGTPFTSQESFSFTSHDELIPAEVLAANGYCDGSVEKCRWAQQNNQVCRGHYSYRVTFHKLD